MKILLDTHIWLWSLGNPRKLGMKLRRRIESGQHELYLSPFSIWEAQCLSAKGRAVEINLPFHNWLERVLSASPVLEAPITFEVASVASSLVLPHPDPGDIFLAATAIVHGLTLATADEQLLACRSVKTIPNV
ncbi:MAG: type II toxin-antitoxin system VapC family toxin [Acidobacteriota bacterium]